MVNAFELGFKIKKLFGLLFLISTSAFTFGQSQPYKIEIPPSPNSTAFMQYGDYPVVLNTGTVPISIPLFELNTGKIKVPISLSYHASGIKLGQVPSSVGLGWVLNAGGVISRVMRGKPDELSQLGYFELASSMKLASEFSASSTDDKLYLYNVLNGEYDPAPDKYNINVTGINAQFAYNKQLEPVIHPFSELIIDGGLAESEDFFKVTDADGTIYRFGKSLLGVDTKEVSQVYVQGPDPSPYVSSWYLTEIISADYADTVYFEYDSIDIYPYSVSRSQQCDHTYGYNGSLPNGSVPDYQYASEFGHNYILYSISRFDNIGNISASVQTVTDARNIKRIKFRSGSIEFSNHAYISGAMRVAEMRILNEESIEVKGYVFGYDYFDDAENRLKLVSVQEFVGQVALPPYEFSYNEEFVMPEYDSPNCDMWGYFNGAINTDFIPTHTVNGITYGSYNNRDVSASHMENYTLNKIQYPTGGYTAFEFEPHEISSIIVGGGLRITAIKNFDDSGTLVRMKTYDYKNGYWIGTPPTFSYQVPHSVSESYFVEQQFSVGYLWEYTSQHHSSSYINMKGGSPVSYETVTEYTGDSNTNNGKTEYKYMYSQDYGQSYQYPYPELTDNSELRSTLIKKIDYINLGGDQYSTVHESTYHYSMDEIDSYYGLKVSWKLQPHKIALSEAIYGTSPYSMWFDVYDEFQRANFIQLDSAVESYSNLSQTTSYEYDNKPQHFQVTSVKFTNSDGAITEKVNKYSTDHSEILGLSTDETNALISMVSKNIVNTPVQVATYIDGVLDNKSTTLYKDNAGSVVPKKVETQFSDNSKRSTLLYFDDNNRLIETKPDDEVSTSAIWDITASKLIAVGENAVYNDIAFTSFEDSHHGNWSLVQEVQNGTTNISLSMINNTVTFKTNTSQSINYTYTVTRTVGPSPEMHFTNLGGGQGYLKYLSAASGSDSFTLPAGDWSVVLYWEPNVTAISVNSTVMTFTKGEPEFSSDSYCGRQSMDFQSLVRMEKTLPNIGEYKLSYVSKNGSISVTYDNATTTNTVTYPMNDGWTLNEIMIETTLVNAKVKLHGSGLIDDLRLHPLESKMTTYTYMPGIGLTTQTDTNFITTYYEYDSFGRLKLIKDDKGNVLQHYTYNYKQN
jgi:hypothetical protein